MSKSTNKGTPKGTPKDTPKDALALASTSPNPAPVQAQVQAQVQAPVQAARENEGEIGGKTGGKRAQGKTAGPRNRRTSGGAPPTVAGEVSLDPKVEVPRNTTPKKARSEQALTPVPAEPEATSVQGSKKRPKASPVPAVSLAIEEAPKPSSPDKAPTQANSKSSQTRSRILSRESTTAPTPAATSPTPIQHVLAPASIPEEASVPQNASVPEATDLPPSSPQLSVPPPKKATPRKKVQPRAEEPAGLTSPSQDSKASKATRTPSSKTGTKTGTTPRAAGSSGVSTPKVLPLETVGADSLEASIAALGSALEQAQPSPVAAPGTPRAISTKPSLPISKAEDSDTLPARPAAGPARPAVFIPIERVSEASLQVAPAPVADGSSASSPALPSTEPTTLEAHATDVLEASSLPTPPVDATLETTLAETTESTVASADAPEDASKSLTDDQPTPSVRPSEVFEDEFNEGAGAEQTPPLPAAEAPGQVLPESDSTPPSLEGAPAPRRIELTAAEPRRGGLFSRVGDKVKKLLSFSSAKQPALPSNADPVEALLDEVFEHFSHKRYRKAVAACERILALDPRCAAAYNNLGSIYMVEGVLDRAAEMYEQALACDPDSPEARENLARLAALAKHRHAIQPATVEEVIEQAKALLADDRVQDAIAVLEDLVTHHPNDVRLLNNLGVLHTRTNSMERAEAIFSHAMEVYFREALPQDARFQMIRENLRKVRALSGQGVSKTLETALVAEVKRRLDGGEKILRHVAGIVRVRYSAIPDDLAEFLSKDEQEADCCAVLVATTRRLHLYGQSTVAFHPVRRFLRREPPKQANFHQDIAYSSIQDVSTENDASKARLTLHLQHGEAPTVYALGHREAQSMMMFIREKARLNATAAVGDLEALPAPRFLVPRPFQEATTSAETPEAGQAPIDPAGLAAGSAPEASVEESMTSTPHADQGPPPEGPLESLSSLP